ncbi:beta-lactamase superfamily domain-containing protein [Phycomyces nitens]|nr:beta-lactamase superfamily domain-containing protein [Phycomyces nitens]
MWRSLWAKPSVRRSGLAAAITTTAAVTLSQRSSIAMSTKEHHHNNGFQNPWPSFTNHGLKSIVKMMVEFNSSNATAGGIEQEKPVMVDMNWPLINSSKQDTATLPDKVVVTWLGHACALVQINGFNILFDPIFSGSYDHLDASTIKALGASNPDARFFVPLGNKAWFGSMVKNGPSGNERVSELDWWESITLDGSAGSVRLTCTPCQHFSGRTMWDRNKTLWASWCAEGIVDKQVKGRVFFGGDTGYRSVPSQATVEQQKDENYLETLPHCPSFKEIGEKIGPFDVALIPIGAYSPRWFMSPVHCSPEDAVRLHQDIKSKHSVRSVDDGIR